MNQQNQLIQALKPQLGQPGMPNIPTGIFPNPRFSNPRPMQMGQIGIRPRIQTMQNPTMNALTELIFDQNQKIRALDKGVYVSGFEKTVTVAMLQNHISKIKNVHAIKLPLTKFNESKGYAFVYFGSQDDAKQVKEKLDRTAILKNKIRITRMVVKNQISIMIFKMKFEGLSPQQIELIQKSQFNQQKLEIQVDKVIKKMFNESVEVNKILIPCSRTTKQRLKYARAFFYVRNLKEASAITNRMDQNANERLDRDHNKKKQNLILPYIMKTLNKNQIFSKFCKAELYDQFKKKQTNILHIKGIKYEGQDLKITKKEIQDFIQQKNPQWNIKSCYVGIFCKGAWANITFETSEEANQAFQAIKIQRAKFRDARIYANLRNTIDQRTIVFSQVKQDVTQKDVYKFLTEAATSSGVIEMNNLQKGRKYDFFSFNIIQARNLYKTNRGEVVNNINSQIDESWRFISKVPRRIIIHFQNQIRQKQVMHLKNHLKTTTGFNNIFKQTCFAGNHQKGHIQKSKSNKVFFQVIGKNATQNAIHTFLTKVAATSAPIDEKNIEKGRIYDFSNFELIQEKNLDQVYTPRRIMVRFINDITEPQVEALATHLKNTAGFKDIFIDKNLMVSYKVQSQIVKDTYISHNRLNNYKPNRNKIQGPPKNNMQRHHHQNQHQSQYHGGKPTQPKIDFTSLKMDVGGIPKNIIPNQGRLGGNIPLVGGQQGRLGGNIPLVGGQQQRFQQMGEMNPSMRHIPHQMGQFQMGSGPNRQQIAGPGMGNRPPPMGGLPSMGSYPPVGGNIKSTRIQEKDQKKEK